MAVTAGRSNEENVLRCFLSFHLKDIDAVTDSRGRERMNDLALKLRSLLRRELCRGSFDGEPCRGHYDGAYVHLYLDQDDTAAWTKTQDRKVVCADVFIAFYSANWFTRPECQRELRMFREGNDSCAVMPVTVFPTGLPGRSSEAEEQEEEEKKLSPERYIARLDHQGFAPFDTLAGRIVEWIKTWDIKYGLGARLSAPQTHDQSSEKVFAGFSLNKDHPYVSPDGVQHLWVDKKSRLRLTDDFSETGALPSKISPSGTTLAALDSRRNVLVFSVPHDAEPWTVVDEPSASFQIPGPGDLGILAVDDIDGGRGRVLVHDGDDVFVVAGYEVQAGPAGPEEPWSSREVVALPYGEGAAVLSRDADILAWGARWYIARDARWNVQEMTLAGATAVAAYQTDEYLLCALLYDDAKAKVDIVRVAPESVERLASKVLEASSMPDRRLASTAVEWVNGSGLDDTPPVTVLIRSGSRALTVLRWSVENEDWA